MQNEISHSFRSSSGYRQRSTKWTSVRLLNIYRLGLSSLFVSQSFVTESPLINIANLRLYSWVSSVFLLVSLVWVLAAWIERRGYHYQVSLQIYGDIIIIILLMHACGGISSGIGMLLIISIAVTGLLAQQALSLIFASLASLGLLAEHIYSSINLANYGGTSTQVGILGATLFATAIITHLTTLRLRSSEMLVQQRERDVALLSALNQEVLENLQAGVIVLGRNNAVRHINQAAMEMLQLAPDKTISLKVDAPELLQALDTWRLNHSPDTPFLPGETGIENIQVSFRPLQSQGQENTLIFLNDVSSIRNSMQQAKLASLGHLVASIAHEIRNPLGAISYAGQLLSENDELAPADRRMTEIIHQHTARINHIIEDILRISRDRPTAAEPLELRDWLPRFVEEFSISKQVENATLDLQIHDGPSLILFDPNHLNQVLTNLCSNAIDHGYPDKPVHVSVFRDQSEKTVLEVADEGPGISPENHDKIFEPFFTSSHKGSGLGLFIVSQLCEQNNATISVHKNRYNGASFVIHPSTPRPAAS